MFFAYANFFRSSVTILIFFSILIFWALRAFFTVCSSDPFLKPHCTRFGRCFLSIAFFKPDTCFFQVALRRLTFKFLFTFFVCLCSNFGLRILLNWVCLEVLHTLCYRLIHDTVDFFGINNEVYDIRSVLPFSPNLSVTIQCCKLLVPNIMVLGLFCSLTVLTKTLEVD